MDKDTLYVTHYRPDRLPEEGLRSVEFLTAKDPRKREEFHMGLDTARTLSQGEIELDLQHGGTVEIPGFHPIRTTEGVWVDQERGVWIADYDNPFEDSNKRKISGEGRAENQ